METLGQIPTMPSYKKAKKTFLFCFANWTESQTKSRLGGERKLQSASKGSATATSIMATEGGKDTGHGKK